MPAAERSQDTASSVAGGWRRRPTEGQRVRQLSPSCEGLPHTSSLQGIPCVRHALGVTDPMPKRVSRVSTQRCQEAHVNQPQPTYARTAPLSPAQTVRRPPRNGDGAAPWWRPWPWPWRSSLAACGRRPASRFLSRVNGGTPAGAATCSSKSPSRVGGATADVALTAQDSLPRRRQLLTCHAQRGTLTSTLTLSATAAATEDATTQRHSTGTGLTATAPLTSSCHLTVTGRFVSIFEFPVIGAVVATVKATTDVTDLNRLHSDRAIGTVRSDHRNSAEAATGLRAASLLTNFASRRLQLRPFQQRRGRSPYLGAFPAA